VTTSRRCARWLTRRNFRLNDSVVALCVVRHRQLASRSSNAEPAAGGTSMVRLESENTADELASADDEDMDN
jgi:hypothetical protein